MLAAGFTHGGGTAMEGKGTERLPCRFWRVGRELGYLEPERYIDAPISLSVTSRPAALATLRLLVEGPRDQIWARLIGLSGWRR